MWYVEVALTSQDLKKVTDFMEKKVNVNVPVLKKQLKCLKMLQNYIFRVILMQQIV